MGTSGENGPRECDQSALQSVEVDRCAWNRVYPSQFTWCMPIKHDFDLSTQVANSTESEELHNARTTLFFQYDCSLKY